HPFHSYSFHSFKRIPHSFNHAFYAFPRRPFGALTNPSHLRGFGVVSTIFGGMSCSFLFRSSGSPPILFLLSRIHCSNCHIIPERADIFHSPTHRLNLHPSQIFIWTDWEQRKNGRQHFKGSVSPSVWLHQFVKIGHDLFGGTQTWWN